MENKMLFLGFLFIATGVAALPTIPEAPVLSVLPSVQINFPGDGIPLRTNLIDSIFEEKNPDLELHKELNGDKKEEHMSEIPAHDSVAAAVEEHKESKPLSDKESSIINIVEPKPPSLLFGWLPSWSTVSSWFPNISFPSLTLPHIGA